MCQNSEFSVLLLHLKYYIIIVARIKIIASDKRQVVKEILWAQLSANLALKKLKINHDTGKFFEV